jgi:hypothetical protein
MTRSLWGDADSSCECLYYLRTVLARRFCFHKVHGERARRLSHEEDCPNALYVSECLERQEVRIGSFTLGVDNAYRHAWYRRGEQTGSMRGFWGGLATLNTYD